MKKSFLAAILLLTTFAFGAAEPANYAGNWVLDFKQSKNLPKFYENVKSHKLFVTQDEKSLNIKVEIDAGRNEPVKSSFAYNLDGTETKTESKMNFPNGTINIPATLKAVVAANGNLKLKFSREMSFTGASDTVEDWKLSEDGKILFIHRESDSMNGKMKMDMVFVKE